MATMKAKYQFFAVLSIFIITLPSTTNSQTAPPPSIGQETKGKPAIAEINNESTSSVETIKSKNDNEGKPATISDSLLGTAKIIESRRESGQIYRIEFEHSFGSKQIIEENDSDGQLASDDNGLDDTPTLSKWRLGSW